MATTAAGTALTAQQGTQQRALVAATLRDLLRLWPAFNPTDVDGSWTALKTALRLLVGERRRMSSSLASSYYVSFRQAERVVGSFSPRPAAPLGIEELDTSLDVTGPVAFKSAISGGKTPKQAKDRALVSVSGSVSRMVQDGGRNTIVGAVTDDREALGWARVTDGDPCAFCAMLASRGPVYTSAETAKFQAHDHDQCGIEPVFHRDTQWPGKAREFEQLWQQSTQGYSGKDAINAFRRAYEEGRQRPPQTLNP